MERKSSAERLKRLLQYFNIKQTDLSKRTGIPKSAVSMHIKGERVPRQDRISDIAEAYNVNEARLMGYDVPMRKDNPDSDTGFDNIYPIELHRIPVLGSVACGEPIFMSEERESYIMSGTEIKADFCLKAKGDSMIGARIMDGDIVFIRSQPEVENGEIAAVAVDDEATLKRFYRDEETGTITLVSENPTYAPMVFTKDSEKMYIFLEKLLPSKAISDDIYVFMHTKDDFID